MTTKHKRWIVWRDSTLAALGDNPWVGAPEKHWRYRSPEHSFATHAEALAYADQRARTIEVVLPRNPLPLTLRGEEGDTEIIVEQNPKENNVTITDEYQRDMIALHRFELQPLALALLAHHYTQEQP